MTDSDKLFKYSKETLEKKINKEKDIKMKKAQFTKELDAIELAYFPADKMTINPNTEKVLPKFKGIKSFTCQINKENKSLKCIIIEYEEFHSEFAHGGENINGDPISGYTTSYQTKQLKIYNNKVYNHGSLERKYEFADTMNRNKYNAIKEAQHLFETVKAQINDKFGIKTYAQKQAERLKKRIL